jgi:RNA polymerase sigma factor (sigma-70 family)
MIGTASGALNSLIPMSDVPRAGVGVHGDGSVSREAASSFELVIRANAGDQKAIDTLFARYLPRLQRWAHGRLPAAARGMHQTHDLVQDTLMHVFERLPTFSPRHEGAFQAYVRTALWNRIRDIARQYQRKGAPDPLDSAIVAGESSPLEEAIGSETLARYEAALDRLRPEDKELIVARVELNLSYAEIAPMVGKPSVAAVHMAVSRALVRLAQEMAHDRKR